ncbi:MAG: Mg(2+) transport ATPase protein [Acidobacteriaceae bacterium]|nr:Mg(2+) transport ATPase protein [Acidobacteriaceae bacterium]
MSLIVLDARHALSFDKLEQWALADTSVMRLLLACALGGAVGLDREYHHKASGVRTNLLICFGAALFTYLSPLIAGELSANKGQIASNIVQGVGFIGAGLILHNRSRVSGLTSAATVFAVAAVGMTCGAGLYVTAVFATALILLSLEGVGALEMLTNLKLQGQTYEVRGSNAEQMYRSVLDAMDGEKRRLEPVERDTVDTITRFTFNVMANRRGHRRLTNLLAHAPAIERVLTFRTWEED